LFRPTNPLYIAPRLDGALVAWLVAFGRACARERFDRSMNLLAEMGWAAGECIRDLIEEEKIDCGYRQSGWLEVFRTERAFEESCRASASLERHGYTVTRLSGDRLREKQPAFRREVVGALHYEDSAFAHPGRLLLGLADRVRSAGVEVRTGREVRRIELQDGRFTGVHLDDGERVGADRAVLAAGAWTTPLARSIGVRIPMQAGKGYHLELDGVSARPATACVLAETFVAVTPLGDGLRLAGTVELSGLNLRRNEKRIAMLSHGARRYIRDLDRAHVRSTWCGLRPMTGDGLPVIGWAPGIRGIFVVTGHAMMGFLLGPLSGRLASEALLDGSTSIDIEALSAERFVGARRTPAPRPAPGDVTRARQRP
jgi:D-amino-acid dehydrogenase